MRSYHIRQVLHDDIDAILRIENESFDPSVREDRGTFQERMEVFPEGFVILEGPEGAVGYLCSELWNLSGNLKPSDFSLGHSARKRHNNRGETLYISSYGLLSNLRGKGLGKSLFRGFLDHTRDMFSHKEIILLVSDTWNGARAVYTAEGFSHLLTVQGFFRFSDGSAADGLVMRRPREIRTARKTEKERR